jgi:hypothetical protein
MQKIIILIFIISSLFSDNLKTSDLNSIETILLSISKNLNENLDPTLDKLYSLKNKAIITKINSEISFLKNSIQFFSIDKNGLNNCSISSLLKRHYINSKYLDNFTFVTDLNHSSFNNWKIKSMSLPGLFFSISNVDEKHIYLNFLQDKYFFVENNSSLLNDLESFFSSTYSIKNGIDSNDGLFSILISTEI